MDLARTTLNEPSSSLFALLELLDPGLLGEGLQVERRGGYHDTRAAKNTSLLVLMAFLVGNLIEEFMRGLGLMAW